MCGYIGRAQRSSVSALEELCGHAQQRARVFVRRTHPFDSVKESPVSSRGLCRSRVSLQSWVSQLQLALHALKASLLNLENIVQDVTASPLSHQMRDLRVLQRQAEFAKK